MHSNHRQRRNRIVRLDIKDKNAGQNSLLIRPAVILAGLFLLAAIVCVLLYTANPQKQADRFLQELYTVNQYQHVDEAVLKEIPGIYRQMFGRGMTDEGMEAAMDLKLPFGLLQKERPVSRTYVPVISLKERPGEEDKKSIKEFTYEVLVETHFIRDGEVVEPVIKEDYVGMIRLKKSGLIRWELDDITSGVEP